jgi:hypothetical protein
MLPIIRSEIYDPVFSIARGHAAIVLLLSALVAYLTRGRGNLATLTAQARNGRLGARFADWIVKHEAALRRHPRLQGRPNRVAGDFGSQTTSTATSRDSKGIPVRQLEPGNPRSTSSLRNGDRSVLDQGNSPTCGPNSCAMVLNTSGKPYDLNRLIADSKVTSQRAYLGDMAHALRNQGLDAARVSNRMTLQYLANATSSGNPAVAAMRLDRGGHAVVVDGVTIRNGVQVVAIRDPALGRQYFTPAQEFMDRFTGQAILTIEVFITRDTGCSWFSADFGVANYATLNNPRN